MKKEKCHLSDIERLSAGEKIARELIRKANECNAHKIEIEYKDGYDEIYLADDFSGIGIDRIKSNTEKAISLKIYLWSLQSGARLKVGEEYFAIKVKIWESFGEDAFRIYLKKIKSGLSCTRTQAEYIAFIYYYTKLHGRAPAEHELVHYFKVAPPTVHQMILRLEDKGLISRTPGQARSIRIIMSEQELAKLKRETNF